MDELEEAYRQYYSDPAAVAEAVELAELFFSVVEWPD